MGKRFIDVTEDYLNKYFKDIEKYPLLSQEEENYLTEKIKEGDASAIEKLVNGNLKFVISIAKKYQNHGLSLNDLINEGNLGLVKAAHKFEPSMGVRFISYAVWWIKQSIIQSLSDNSRLVRLPVSRLNKISKFKEDDDRPSDLVYTTHVSLDAKIDDEDDETYLSLFVNDTSEIDSDNIDILKKKISRLLINLSPRERDVIDLYFGLSTEESLTLEVIGERHDLTKERVRQIKERALRRLRHIVHEYNLK